MIVNFRVLLASCFALAAAFFLPGIGMATDSARYTCQEWYSGRVVGYLYWGSAPSDEIRRCVGKHGVGVKDSYNLTPLHHALTNPHVRVETIRLLIDLGADVNLPGYQGVTPLIMAAAYTARPDVFRILLQAGADPTVTDAWGANAIEVLKQNHMMSRTNQRRAADVLRLAVRSGDASP
jgi:hypothetical protein